MLSATQPGQHSSSTDTAAAAAAAAAVPQLLAGSDAELLGRCSEQLAVGVAQLLRVTTSAGEACSTPQQLAERCAQLRQLPPNARVSSDGQQLDGESLSLMYSMCTSGTAPGEQKHRIYAITNQTNKLFLHPYGHKTSCRVLF
jgi:hypothetical protein